MTTFLSLFRVRFSEKTKTACVTCGGSPELLLNKDFIEAHCQTNEHLFMLVMHELYHVILGHTTLFPRATEVRNIVFDAVINAILCSLFPKPEFTSFFTDYYPSDKMPSALLRPKGEGTPLAAEQALKLLYGGSDTGTYHDVYEALLKSGCIKEIMLSIDGGAAGVRALPGNGSHGRARTPAAPPAACAVSNEEIEEIARQVYRVAGYGGIWIHAPEKLKVIQNVCLEPLSDDERAIRSLSDDQNVVTGFACNHPETDYLPPAHFIANYIGLKERGGSAVTVRLGWTPGDAAPAFREAESVDSLGLTHPIPASALPPEDWFRIDTIVSEMRLATLVRRERVLAGYFVDSRAFE